ncbi:hypothetical protein CNMCM5623_006936 [Aspergillus felis]|uniref:Ankyrin repeat-containing protein n=1 Tax=Aspergillus felis TaxID=1287682 RepID=A0A8H6QKG2_9EURO|nr:hypothetical protein CNMCM5623_006936 [Aspergillus felis]
MARSDEWLFHPASLTTKEEAFVGRLRYPRLMIRRQQRESTAQSREAGSGSGRPSIGPGASVAVHSLAIDAVRRNSKVATLSFHTLPDPLSEGSKDQWKFALPSDEDEDTVDTKHTLILDTHFAGFTPLQHSEEDSCDVDVIAMSGLGGHAFDSFKERGGSFMWLRDALPLDFPNARILIYGYDTRLVRSSSFQNLTDLGRALQIDMKAIRVIAPRICTQTCTKIRRACGVFLLHGRGTLLQKMPLGVFRALLNSMLKSFPVDLSEVTLEFEDREKLFGSYEKGRWTWTEKELQESLFRVLTKGTKAHPVVIFVDALDESVALGSKSAFDEFLKKDNVQVTSNNSARARELEKSYLVDVNAKDKQGETPLTAAITLNAEEVIYKLLEVGAEHDNKDMLLASESGITALVNSFSFAWR